jgi:GT2 family glycosyltransferase
VVVLNYRTPGMTVDCLESLEPQAVAVPGTRVYVVDNASGDGSDEQIAAAIQDREWAAWCELIVSPVNGGFAAGNNLALEAAEAAGGYELALLLNSDTLLRPGAVQELMAFLEGHPGVGIVGSRLEDPDGTPQASTFRFPSVMSSFESGIRLGVVSRVLKRWIVAMPVRDEAHRADWLCGASLMIRREVIDRVGLLDAGYFMYFEETDFCLAARRAGFEAWYVPASRVVHLVGQASGVTSKRPAGGRTKRRPRYWFDSRRRYFIKNHGRFGAAMADAAWILGYGLHRVRQRLTGRPDGDPERLLGDSIRQSVFVRGFRI